MGMELLSNHGTQPVASHRNVGADRFLVSPVGWVHEMSRDATAILLETNAAAAHDDGVAAEAFPDRAKKHIQEIRPVDTKQMKEDRKLMREQQKQSES